MASTGTFGWPTPDDTDFVRDGASAIRALGDAVDLTLAGGFVYAGTRYFFSDGSFAKADPLLTGNIGLRAIRVTCVGGGGGGAGSSRDLCGGAGGGGGGTAIRFLTDMSALSSSESVVRGLGGSGGAAGDNAGLNGGNSAFGAFLTAGGGGGGLPPDSGSIAGLGGAASGTFDVAFAGSPGGNGANFFVQAGPCGPNGGSSSVGGGGVGGVPIGTGGGGSGGQGHGGGGGGGYRISADHPGGNGANGVVIVDCFI